MERQLLLLSAIKTHLLVTNLAFRIRIARITSGQVAVRVRAATDSFTARATGTPDGVSTLHPAQWVSLVLDSSRLLSQNHPPSFLLYSAWRSGFFVGGVGRPCIHLFSIPNTAHTWHSLIRMAFGHVILELISDLAWGTWIRIIEVRCAMTACLSV